MTSQVPPYGTVLTHALRTTAGWLGSQAVGRDTGSYPAIAVEGAGKVHLVTGGASGLEHSLIQCP